MEMTDELGGGGGVWRKLSDSSRESEGGVGGGESGLAGPTAYFSLDL